MDREEFFKKVEETKFPFEVDSFHDFHIASIEYNRLFDEANRGGICFIKLLVAAIKTRQLVIINEKVQEALEKQRGSFSYIQDRDFKTGDEEYDAFRRKCINHDWYYSYSDDGGVWKNGERVRKELEATVATKGGKYKEYWEYASKTFGK